MTLAAHKTEAVLKSGRKIELKIEVTLGDTRIESKNAIKYLGVIIDDRLNLKEHMKSMGEKAYLTQEASIILAQYGRKYSPWVRQGGYYPRCIV